MKKALLTLLLLATSAGHVLAAAPSAEQICDRYSDALDPQRPRNLPVVHYHPVDTLQAGVHACLEMLKLRPDDPRILYQTGNAYRVLADAALSDVIESETSTDLRTLRKALNFGLNPGTFPHNSNPQAVARLENLKQQARLHYGKAAAHGYLTARHVQALQTLYQEGDRSASKKAFESLLDAAPALAHDGLAKWHLTQAGNSSNPETQARHMESALRHYEQAHKQGHPSAIATILSFRRKDREPLAPEILQSLDRNNPDLLAHVAVARYHSGDKATSKQLFDELRQRGKHDKNFHTAAQYVEAMLRQSEANSFAESMRLFLPAERAGHAGARSMRQRLRIHQKAEEAP